MKDETQATAIVPITDFYIQAFFTPEPDNTVILAGCHESLPEQIRRDIPTPTHFCPVRNLKPISEASSPIQLKGFSIFWGCSQDSEYSTMNVWKKMKNSQLIDIQVHCFRLSELLIELGPHAFKSAIDWLTIASGVESVQVRTAKYDQSVVYCRGGLRVRGET